ncbi:bis(5'-nucleosyl)-tetraphosphatase (symmetrical) YqeK [Alteribacillus iranensis]|uniref:bis(5'-nucleosyl)-tetraphosphatase (symmetrical) YqeK n=1 Tax=Alteribacillus iranensis TaxID=930128 RepID=UPI000B863EF6|nr:bis(5'-nucleosyl)-tetraphosphatase (symmetrical) YqeK [Alteribacillus iranensis]
MDQKTALKLVKPHLTNKRYIHTVGVMNTAVNLAHRYEVNTNKAKMAAIFHDYAKYRSVEEMREIIQKNGWDERFIQFNNELLHAPAGSYLVEKEIGIKDSEILSAIFWHTTGKANMDPLEKVIFLADYIEPNRNFPGVKEVREQAEVDLDRAVLMALHNTVLFLMSKEEPVFPETLHAYNDLVLEISKQNKKG